MMNCKLREIWHELPCPQHDISLDFSVYLSRSILFAGKWNKDDMGVIEEIEFLTKKKIRMIDE